jgi:hypothetical protein
MLDSTSGSKLELIGEKQRPKNLLILRLCVYVLRTVYCWGFIEDKVLSHNHHERSNPRCHFHFHFPARHVFNCYASGLTLPLRPFPDQGQASYFRLTPLLTTFHQDLVRHFLHNFTLPPEVVTSIYFTYKQ